MNQPTFSRCTVFIVASAITAVVLCLCLCLSGCGSGPNSNFIPKKNLDSSVADVTPATTGEFTVSLEPWTLTIAPGKSASTTVTTKVEDGFDHALTLGASGVPAGVTVKFDPAEIAAPGSGTSDATVTVSPAAVPGTYSVKVTATGDSKTASAILTLKISASSSNPDATFQGCWYKTGGHRYQGVYLSVKNPGTYSFDADLYYGTTCDPNTQADEFGNGQLIDFGGFGYIFWFTAFADKTDMSALWHVGSNTSQCMNYETAPACE